MKGPIALCSTTFFVIVAVLSTLSQVGTTRAEVSERRVNDTLLLVISYDGFSPHYLEGNITPNLQAFRQKGTFAPFLRNVFPTKTFPNHQSIATGLFPAEHGVVGSDIYDTDLGELEYGSDLYEFGDSLPIWTVNELAGGKSGCMQWPGSEFSYATQRVNCSFTERFNTTHSSPWEERVNRAMEWFSQGATLVMLYIEEPDRTGHMVGVNSNKEREMIKQLDELTKYVERRISNSGLHDRLNVILVSDHGMINTTPSKFINLTQWLPSHRERIYGSSPVLQIYPTTIEVDDLYRILLNASSVEKTFKVYRNKDLPSRWQYRSERRTGPITVVAEPGYAFQDMWKTVRWYEKQFNIPVTNDSQYGLHGYDNAVESMHSMFIAKGPAIKEHHQVPPFDTVDLFHLFCEVLKIKPPTISGNRDNILDIMVDYNPPASGIPLPLLILISAMIAVVLLASTVSFVLVRRRGRETRQVVPPYIYDEPDMVVGLTDEHQKLLEITPSKPHMLSDIDI